MQQVTLPDGTLVPALGQGTWTMGERPDRRRDEIAALRAGIDLGMTVIDTAEMYGEGATEALLANAIEGVRDQVFLVSKAYPHHGGPDDLAKACDASLRRLGTDRLDLYLLHWRGAVPLADTVAGMQALVAAGKILRWGVSNFDLDDLEDLWAAGGQACAANQILLNPNRRGPEFEVLPWLKRAGVPIMAYSPVEQGRLTSNGALRSVAARIGATPVQVALAWVLGLDNVIAIPKAGNVAHVRENRRAADVVLSDQDRAELDRAFPPPGRRTRLEML